MCRRWCSYVMWAFSIVSVVFLNLATKMSSADWVVGQSLRGQLPAEEEEEEEKEEEMEGGVWTASRLPPARLDHSSAPASRGKTCPPSSLFCHSDYSNFPLFSTFPPLHFVSVLKRGNPPGDGFQSKHKAAWVKYTLVIGEVW